MVIALDIETKNLSTEIGGWGNTHMFLVSTVATWDGTIGKAYVEEELMDKVIEKTDMQVLPLRQLKSRLKSYLNRQLATLLLQVELKLKQRLTLQELYSP